MTLKEIELIIPAQYLSTTVQKYEAIYLFGKFTDGSFDNKDYFGNKCEIKIGSGNQFYKYPIRKLINKKVRGYICENTITKIIENKRIKYRCKKCRAYSTNKKIVHYSNICRKRRHTNCMFYIFREDEYEKMNEIQKYNKAIQMEEANKEILDNEEEMDVEDDEEEEEEEEENKIFDSKIEKTKYVEIWQEKGNYYINKKVNELEYEITIKLQKYDHFPKILHEQKIHNGHIITMPYYEGKKIKFNENMWFVKNYIKSLLISIKKLNSVGYVHGDIKPENFIYNNPNYYYLIDFNGSGKIGKKMKIKKLPVFLICLQKKIYLLVFLTIIFQIKKAIYGVSE